MPLLGINPEGSLSYSTATHSASFAVALLTIAGNGNNLDALQPASAESKWASVHTMNAIQLSRKTKS